MMRRYSRMWLDRRPNFPWTMARMHLNAWIWLSVAISTIALRTWPMIPDYLRRFREWGIFHPAWESWTCVPISIGKSSIFRRLVCPKSGCQSNRRIRSRISCLPLRTCPSKPCNRPQWSDEVNTMYFKWHTIECFSRITSKFSDLRTSKTSPQMDFMYLLQASMTISSISNIVTNLGFSFSSSYSKAPSPPPKMQMSLPS